MRGLAWSLASVLLAAAVGAAAGIGACALWNAIRTRVLRGCVVAPGLGAIAFRNKLLLFRFRNLRRPRSEVNDIDHRIEPRLRQIFLPLLGVIDDPQVRERLAALATHYHHDLVTERAMDTEAHVLQVIRDILDSGTDAQLSIKEISAWFSDRHSADYERKITAKWIGWVIRQRLHLKAERRSGLFVIPTAEYSKLARLYERYGVSADDRHNPGGLVDVPKY